jgi:hypothetical protein
MYPDRDGDWWGAARAAAVPSLALVDHWSTPRERFSAAEPFDCVPDAVGVVDGAVAAGLEALGFPGAIHVTGHPHFEELVTNARAIDRADARRALGVKADRTLGVFVSEPLARQYGTSREYRPEALFPYTEDEVLGLVRDAFERAAPTGILLVKLHPLEEADAFAGLALNADPARLRVIRSCPPELLLAAADAVMGMTSTLLLEAAFAGARAMSVRPRDETGTLVWMRPGIVESVCDPRDVPGAMELLLTDRGPDTRTIQEMHAVGLGAIGRVTDLLRELARARAISS